METRSTWTVCALLVIGVALSAHASPAFPTLSELEVEFYQTEVTLTDTDQNITTLGTEYYDNTVPRGRVDILALGNKFSLFYNNATNQILEVNTTDCHAWDIDESLYDYEPLFFGWLNQKPLVIGPSAPLWYAQDHRGEIVTIGETVVRDIKCDAYSLKITEARQELTYTFYFAAENWTTPYQMKSFRVPIRIEVRGQSSKYAQSADMIRPVNQITDFAYFRPTITEWLAFQPPVGIGCPLRKSSRTIPVFPKVFTYSAEVVDLIKAAEEEMRNIMYQRVWYDMDRKMARLDNYTRTKYTSELYDFKSGVTYKLTDGSSCSIGPLKNSFFEGYDGKVMGHLKDPEEVLDLDGSFYYMGKKPIRGIWADAFESVKTDVTFQGQPLSKLVVTIYYSQDFYKVAVDGETETQVPIFYVVTGWKGTEIVVSLQYNIFEFDDVIWPDMYQSFGLDKCFPTMMDKSYFVLIIPVDEATAAKMEGLDAVVVEQLREKISKQAMISDMRLPLLNVDYKPSGVFVTGLMLERPPALKQFIKRGNDDESPTPDMKIVFDAATLEDCASACLDDGNFTCTGFHFCNKACFIMSSDLDASQSGSYFGVCEIWGRADRDSNNAQANLKEALVLLEENIINKNLKISLRFDEDTDAIITIDEIIFGDGPFGGKNNQEKPYSAVVSYRQFNADDESTQVMPYTDSVSDCYQACKSSEAVTCSSFSFCGESHQCRLSSILVVDRNHNPQDLEDAKDCTIYSMQYLDYYDAYPGKIVMTSGDDVYKNIPSVEVCAMTCRLESSLNCRGFDYCRTTRSCVLHKKHILDLNPGEISNGNKGSCTHYAVKFSADYYHMGNTLIDDTSDVRTGVTIEECSRTCTEELKSNCKSFNFCPSSGPGFTDSSCALSGKVLKDDRVTLTTKDKCHHYEKKKEVDDWGTTKLNAKTVSTSGYTSKGFTGLVIGMLALGLVLGAVIFVLYSYFRSKSSGEGMTVRFMKSDI